MKRISGWLPEAAVLLAACAARLPGAARAAISESEARLWMFASEPWSSLWNIFSLRAEHHSGDSFAYVVLLKLWMAAGGDGLLWMRIPSIAAGIGAVALTYALARRLFGRPAGCVAALMLALMASHAGGSRLSGAASISIFLCLLTLLLFHKIFESEAGRAASAAFAVSALAGLCFGVQTAMLLVPINILFFGFARERRRRLVWWIPLNIFLFAAAAYWMTRWASPFFMPAGVDPEEAIFHIFPKESFLSMNFRLVFMMKYVSALYTIGGLPGGASSLSNGFAFIGAVLLPIVYHYFPFVGFREYPEGYRPRLFAFVTLAGLLAFAGLLSMTVYQARLWEALVPGAIMLYAVCANGAARFAGWRARALLALMLLCAAAGFVPMQRATENARPDWAGASDALASVPGASVVFIDGSIAAPAYYATRSRPDCRDRIIALWHNFDLTQTKDGGYRQSAVAPALGATIDSHPPDGAAEALSDYRAISAGGAWFAFKGSINIDENMGGYILDPPQKPRWAREYAIWLIKNARIIKAYRMDGGFRDAEADASAAVENTDKYYLLWMTAPR